MSEAYKQLSLREAAAFDKENGAKERETGWGKLSRLRREQGISRKARAAKRLKEAA